MNKIARDLGATEECPLVETAVREWEVIEVSDIDGESWPVSGLPRLGEAADHDYGVGAFTVHEIKRGLTRAGRETVAMIRTRYGAPR